MPLFWGLDTIFFYTKDYLNTKPQPISCLIVGIFTNKDLLTNSAVLAMKKIYLVFITLLGLTINANSQSGFIKETHHFEIDTILRVAVLFDREY